MCTKTFHPRPACWLGEVPSEYSNLDRIRNVVHSFILLFTLWKILSTCYMLDSRHYPRLWARHNLPSRNLKSKGLNRQFDECFWPSTIGYVRWKCRVWGSMEEGLTEASHTSDRLNEWMNDWMNEWNGPQTEIWKEVEIVKGWGNSIINIGRCDVLNIAQVCEGRQKGGSR